MYFNFFMQIFNNITSYKRSNNLYSEHLLAILKEAENTVTLEVINKSPKDISFVVIGN